MSNMLTTIVFEGRPSTTPELTVNQKTGGKYVRLTVMQNKGYSSETEHAVPFTCFFYGQQAERLIKAKVQQGNLLTITGDFDSKEYMRKDKDDPNQLIHDRSLEVNVSNWSYTPQNRQRDDASNQSASGNLQGQTAQGTPPAQNYQPAGNAAPPQQSFQQYPAQQPNYQQPPASGYQQQTAYPQSQAPAGVPYNQGTANGFANVPQEPLPFSN